MADQQKRIRFWLKHYGHVPHVVVYIHGLSSIICQEEAEPCVKAGFGVFFGFDNPLNGAYNFEGRQTANVAGIVAAIVALNHISRNSKFRCVEVHVCSTYVIQAACNRRKWMKNGWRSAGGQPLRNLKFFLALYEEIDKFKHVYFTYTNESSGGHGFLNAVELATTAVDEYKKYKPDEPADDKTVLAGVSVPALVNSGGEEPEVKS